MKKPKTSALLCIAVITSSCGEQPETQRPSTPEAQAQAQVEAPAGPAPEAPTVDLGLQRELLDGVAALTGRLGATAAAIGDQESLESATDELRTLNAELVSLQGQLAELKPLDQELLQAFRAELSDLEKSVHGELATSLADRSFDLEASSVREFHHELERFRTSHAAFGATDQ